MPFYTKKSASAGVFTEKPGCCRMGGKVWMRQMLASAFLLPAVVCGTAFFINFIAIYYHASRAIPFGTMASLTDSTLLVSLN